jgi:glycosyltransferase 2 family protein
MTPDRELLRAPVQAGLSVRTSDWLGAQWLLLVKVATSTILLAWIVSRASFSEILAAFSSASIPLLLAAYALTVVGTMLTVSRWRLLLRAQGAPLPFLRLLHSYLVAMFFNNFLPSTVGGDASRAYDCYRMTGGNRRAMSSVVLDRLLGLLALLVFALGSLHFAKAVSDQVPVLALWLSLAVIGLGGVVGAIFFGLPSRGTASAMALIPRQLHRVIAAIVGAFELYRGQWQTLAIAFALSLLLQFNVIVHFVLIAQALGLDVPARDFCLIVPLVSFVIMLPISINGIGLRENALAVMLGYYGAGAAEAVALAWLVHIANLILSLAGGLIYASRR